MNELQQDQQMYDNIQPLDFPELPEVSGVIEHQMHDDIRLKIAFRNGQAVQVCASDTQGNWHVVPASLWDCFGEQVAYLERAYDELLEKEGVV